MACSKQKPIRIDRYEMPVNYSIEDCVDEAIKIANRTQIGVSFEHSNVSLIIYPLCSKRISNNTKEYYLQVFAKKQKKK